MNNSMFTTNLSLIDSLKNTEEVGNNPYLFDTSPVIEDGPKPQPKRKRNFRRLYDESADLTKYNQKIKDEFESYVVHFERIPEVPYKIALVGMSQMSGKSNTLITLQTRPFNKDDTVEGYADVFKPENIYLIGPPFTKDTKWKNAIVELQIPSDNIMPVFDNDRALRLLENINSMQRKREETGLRKEHYLIIYDDVSFDGSFKSKKHGAIAKIFCNERHNLVSVICTSQAYVDFSKTMRRNVTCLLAYPGLGESDIKLIKDDMGAGIGIKEMTEIYTKCTAQPYHYLSIFKENFKPYFRDKDFRMVDNSIDRQRGYVPEESK